LKSKDSVVHHQKYDRAHNSNEQAIKIQLSYPWVSERVEYEPADNCAHNSEYDIEPNTLARLIDKLAADEPGQKAYDDPNQN
jgi:hypothetical protein